jgi:hypothetical protein
MANAYNVSLGYIIMNKMLSFFLLLAALLPQSISAQSANKAQINDFAIEASLEKQGKLEINYVINAYFPDPSVQFTIPLALIHSNGEKILKLEPNNIQVKNQKKDISFKLDKKIPGLTSIFQANNLLRITRYSRLALKLIMPLARTTLCSTISAANGI